MAPRRVPALVVAGAALLGACAGGGGVAADYTSTTIAESATTTAAAAPTTTAPGHITFTLSIEDDGARLRVRRGDEVVPRLPLSGLEDPGWVVLIPPDSEVLAGGDDLLWHPSEIAQGGVAFHEFNFVAAGPGVTSVTLTHGWQEFSFTVVVAEE